MAPPSSDAASDPPRRLFILDGHSLAYRAFFALPSTLATTTGQVTNAVYGFTSMLIKLLAEEHPDLIAVAFDVGKPVARLAMDADYKAGRRETPEDFKPQLGLIQEVVEALRIRMLRVTDHEADDAIGTLAIQAAERGIEATIVTADRDFFQLVRPGIRVLFNRRGISDIALMDEAAVEERFGVPPSKYLEYVALKGDTSDNIPGVPGVGDKTAAKLVQDFGSVEELLGRTDELKGKLKENIEAAGERLILNKDLARIVTDVPLDVEPQDAAMGEWDVEEVRRLFISLEFRSLFDRLMELAKEVKPKVDVTELDLRRVSPDELAGLLAGDPVGVAIHEEADVLIGLGVSAGGAQAAYAALDGPGPVGERLADPATPKWTHDAKALERVTLRAGALLEGVAFDTMLAGYLLDPGTADYPLASLSERYLGTDLFGGEEEVEAEGQLFTEDPWRRVAAEAAAVALLAPVLEEQIDRQGLRHLLEDVELPLASVLARMEARGVRLDVPYLEEMGESVRDRMATLKAEVFRQAGQEFNLNSPPQLRAILYDQLGLQPGKKTPKGELSTDASVLEKLRDAHPIVDALLSWRELDKLNSTYLEALPRLVDPKDGRLHTSFNQTVAATGRLSSSNPNLQNIPDPVRARSPDPPRVHPGRGRPGPAGRRLLADRAPDPRASLGRHRSSGGVRLRPRHPRRHRRDGLRPSAGARRRGDATAREGGELRPRVRDERMGTRHPVGHHRRRGPGVHRRLLRRVPGDQGIPPPPGGPGDDRRVHGDPPGTASIHPGAPGGATRGSATSGVGRP